MVGRGDSVRVTQPFWTIEKRVEQIRLRITARDTPADSSIRISDVQLQPGSDASGVVPNVREAGTNSAGTEYRNGVVHDGLDVVVLADPDRSSPTRMEVLNADADTRLGSYRFGSPGSAYVDGRSHEASAGWGRAPIITERSDLYLKPYLGQRVHLRLSWNERTT